MFRFLILFVLAAPVAADEAVQLIYRVQQTGEPAYISRFLITEKSVRLDEGGGNPLDAYTLFDRASGVFYNVDPEEQTVLELHPSATQPQLPADLHLSQSQVVDEDAPKVAGRKPLRLKLFANGQLCRELLVVDLPLPDALLGLQELRKGLARLQLRSLKIPGMEMNDCERAEWIYAPQRALEQGFPISDVMGGKTQLLLDYKTDATLPSGAFDVPAAYQRINPPALF